MIENFDPKALVGKTIISFNREYIENDETSRGYKKHMIQIVSGVSNCFQWIVTKWGSNYSFTRLDGNIECILERLADGEPGSLLNKEQNRQLEIISMHD